LLLNEFIFVVYFVTTQTGNFWIHYRILDKMLFEDEDLQS